MITIRQMDLDDLEEVIAIEKSLFSVPWTETGFFSFLMRNDTLFLVAEEAEHVVGYCGIVMVLDEGDITNVGVQESCQSRGIGKQLVRALIAKVGEKGVTHLHLEVRKSNARAFRLYESLGFEQVGVRKGYYEAPAEDGILMSRS